MMASTRAIATALAAIALCPALAREPVDAAAFAGPSGLSAVLTEEGHIDVSWKNHATADGGYWVEFTNPGADFIKLAAVWPEMATFQHPDVAPDSVYMYRIRPFFGAPSEAVGVATGPAPSEGSPETAVEGPIEGASPAAVDDISKKSLKTIATFAGAAPTAVTASLTLPTTVELHWQDRASDEDGYLVEISLHPDKDFQVCALLPPDAASFRKVSLPPETKCWFRVRAFFDGSPSDVVSVATRQSTPES